MTLSILNVGRVIAGCVLVLALLQLVANLVMTYAGYDPKAFLGRCILRKRWSAGLAVLAWLLLHSANIYVEQLMDRGPFLMSVGDLIGTWRKGDRSFRLYEDVTIEPVGTSDRPQRRGQWRLAPAGDGLEIHDESGTLTDVWRIVQFRGEYRILCQYEATEWAVPADMGFSRAATDDLSQQSRPEPLVET